MMTARREVWYVVASPGRNMYMSWQGNHVNGAYIDTGNPLLAERFMTRPEAVAATRRDPRVIKYMHSRLGIQFGVCRIEMAVKVTQPTGSGL